MASLINFFKSQASVLSILIWLLLAAFIFYRFNKKKVTTALLIIAAIFFYASSTAWLPRYLAKQLEKQYAPLDAASLKSLQGKVYIHLLGSGYNIDDTQPATSQLGVVAECRLVEAMRLYVAIDSSVIVCSGSGPSGMETQAAVAKKAAVLLGADSNRVITLETPTTTQEEASALADKVGKNANVIVVTDAIHMPRACKMFAKQGFKPIAAPATFRAREGKQGSGMRWWPDLMNIYTMDRVLHEYAGSLKASL